MALMTVFRNEGQWDTSNVEFRDGRILAYDKVTRSPAMQYIDYGLGVLNRCGVRQRPRGRVRCDLAAVYQEMLRRGELAGFEVTERFYEIGSVAGLEGDEEAFFKRNDEIMTQIENLKVKIFADGADRTGMLRLYRNPLIKGFTTNPTLMHAAGITNYEAFAHDILQSIPDRPISLEVFSDDFAEMESQACRIASWGEQVYVKIPVTNTQGESSIPLIRCWPRLASSKM